MLDKGALSLPPRYNSERTALDSVHSLLNCLLGLDFKLSEHEVSDLHKQLKVKVNKLYETENKPDLKRFDLIPISKEEKQSLFNLVGED